MITDKSLKLGIPSKGRLKKLVLEWFSESGIEIFIDNGGRGYNGSIPNISEFSVIFLSANDIPQEIKKGSLHLGITGQDLVQEKVPFWQKHIFELKKLNFGHADLVLAVPEFWIDVNNLEDFDDIAVLFRKKNGFPLRIATKYHNLVWSFLRENGIVDYSLIDSQGATEGSIRNLFSEAIADISSTGATLKANNLKVITEQPILQSQCVLFGSKNSLWRNQNIESFKKFCDKIKINNKSFVDIIS